MTGHRVVEEFRSGAIGLVERQPPAPPVRKASRLGFVAAGLLLLAGIGAGVTAGQDALDFLRADHQAGNLRGLLFGRPAEPTPIAAPAPVRAEPARTVRRVEEAPRAAGVTRDPPGRFSFCVRSCDGYFFPIGDLSSARDLILHREACASSCPGAETALYVADRSRDIADAVALAGGTPYTDLATAYSHRTAQVSACTCTPRDASTRIAALDRTLRPGDVVVTTEGAQVLQSGGRFASYDAQGATPRALRAMIAATLGPNHAATWRAYAETRPSATRLALLPPRRPAEAPAPTLVAEATAPVSAAPVVEAAPAPAPVRAGFVAVSGEAARVMPLPPRRPIELAAAAEPAPRRGFVALN